MGRIDFVKQSFDSHDSAHTVAQAAKVAVRVCERLGCGRLCVGLRIVSTQ